MSYFSSDPESSYVKFITECNDVVHNLQNVLSIAQELATDSDKSFCLGSILLGCDVSCQPTWENLFRSRMQWDLCNPDMFSLSPITNYVSVKVTFYHPDDVTQAAARSLQSRLQVKLTSIDDYIYSSIYTPLLDLLGKEQKAIGISLRFQQQSLRHLFGIDRQASSIQLVRAKLSTSNYHKILRIS